MCTRWRSKNSESSPMYNKVYTYDQSLSPPKVILTPYSVKSTFYNSLSIMSTILKRQPFGFTSI